MTSRHRRLGVNDVIAGRFRLTAEIGEGGMGRVYEAIDLRHARNAAVKLISRRLAQNHEFRARFEREAEAAEHANHPHVLPVWDYGDEGDYLYLATPLCDTDLAAVLEDRGRLSVDEALRLLGQVAWALDWAHGRGVLHRDVKPENILLIRGRTDAHAYLADFGMARMVSAATLTQIGQAPGLSPAYAAPEQWRAEPVSPATDQYALAATLFCCLAGRPPFAGDSIDALRHAHLSATPPALDGEVSPDARAISEALCVGLSKSPQDRYGSCEELIASVSEASVSETFERDVRRLVDQRAPTDPEHPSSPARPGEGRDAETIVDRGDPPEIATPPAKPPAAVETVAGREPALAARAEQAEVAEPHPGAPPPATRSGPRRRRVTLVAVGAVLVAAAAAAAVLLASGGDSETTRTVTIGGLPQAVDGAGGSVWVADSRGGTVSRIAAPSGEVAASRIKAVRQVTHVAASRSEVWAVSADGRVQGIEAGRDQPFGQPLSLDVDVYDLAAGPDALWVANGAGQVIEVPVEGQVLKPARPAVNVGAGARGVSVARGRVWAVARDAKVVTWLDAASGEIVGSRGVPAAVEDVTTLGTSVWAADPTHGQVLRLDPVDGHVRARLSVPAAREAALVSGDGMVFYVSLDTGVPIRIDPATDQAHRIASLGPHASSATVAQHQLWVAYPDAGTVKSVSF